MKLYTKRIKAHQAKFLLLQLFENALRSTLAIYFANKYKQDKGDLFLKNNEISKSMKEIIKKDVKKSIDKIQILLKFLIVFL